MSDASVGVDAEKEDAQQRAASIPSLQHRSLLFKVLFILLVLCLIPVIIVPAVILTRRNAPQNSGRKLFSQAKTHQERAGAVKDAFLYAWGGYMQHAFPHDQLLPLTNSFSDPRDGWGSTAVDSLSTAIIMGHSGPVATMLRHISSIDFTHSNGPISVFETNIRYLGGMLSAYDLLEGPFSGLPHNPALRENLLSQAKKLADVLSIAFNTPTGIPENTIIFNGATPVLNGSTRANIAEIGTLVLEWTRLSNLLGDQKYAGFATRAQQYLLQPKPPQSEIFPGLIGSFLSIADGSSVDQTGGWGGGSDSFYEYLIKAYVYSPSSYASYKDRWVLAADSSMMYLASHPNTRTDLTFLSGFDGTKGIPESGHLNCFAGGNFLLGGQVLGQQKYIDFGLSLTASCHNTYRSTQTGIGPESFQWIPQECSSGAGIVTKQATFNATEKSNQYSIKAQQDSTSQKASLPSVTHTTFDCRTIQNSRATDQFYQGSGFQITNPTYNLRPEVLESYYYAYRITGNTMYQDWAWDAFNAINTYARIGDGFNYLGNVNIPGGDNRKGNGQESYFFAETLKYAYLIFGEDGPWQVNYKGKNEFVFNTEGHPLKVA